MEETFEWDADKALRNLEKHRVSFSRAIEVFRDVFAIEKADLRKPYPERRYIITGKAKGYVLSVVYTEREGHIRIISARRASRDEREDYHRENRL